jgi:CheY-like chemotaxis protein
MCKTDIQMPVMDGFEAAKRLRVHEMEEGVPEDERQRIIGISANSEEIMEIEALASGMNAFIPVSLMVCGVVWVKI